MIFIMAAVCSKKGEKGGNPLEGKTVKAKSEEIEQIKKETSQKIETLQKEQNQKIEQIAQEKNQDIEKMMDEGISNDMDDLLKKAKKKKEKAVVLRAVEKLQINGAAEYLWQRIFLINSWIGRLSS